ncbi:BRCT domain [Cinara cedri]|uniref:BRCT domain n=1 Tax=Cinara cedri TaxID=506608 RepID=A0A5E4MHL9_9HEMI|nr:BRCT domain [Cinara cedri]
MSCQIPRHVLQRVSDRKTRKLAVDESDPTSSDTDIMLDSKLDIIEDSQSPLKGYRDLFGEFIPYNTPVNSANNMAPKNKLVNKTQVKKKKNQSCEKNKKTNPKKRQPRIFPTPKIIKIMQNAQTELYSIMGHSSVSSSDSSREISVESNNNLNVSGIHHLLNSPTSSSKRNTNCEVLKGVFAFVDYKLNGGCCNKGIQDQLFKLGAQVEKTFNLKVTHIVFRDGNPKTYDKAIERNIPLVSARWVHNSRVANKILDPIDYPPVDIEKFKKPLGSTYNITKHNTLQQTVRLDKKDQMFKKKRDDLVKHVNNFPVYLDENNENSTISKTSKKQNPLIERIDSQKTNDNIITILSDQLCKVLNTNDSPMPNKNIDELYLPMSIKQLRKILTPSEKENKTPTKFDSDLVQIEDCLNLNSQARRRLRKLLFPTTELPNLTIDSDSDFPSPSPQKLRISAPAKLTSSKKQKNKINTVSQNKKFNNEKTPPTKRIDKNGLGWRIPTELRPKKKKNIPKGKSMQAEKTQTSVFSRNSSTVFETPQSSLADPVVLQKIACTGMKRSEVANIKLAIQNLGKFTFDDKVKPSTTYLITKSHADRTLNMVFAMAFGCYIVSEKWIHESNIIGKWIPHQPYLITNLSEPVKKFQARRQMFGSLLTFHIFDDAGSIYISNTCEPSARQLKRLVRACGGQCTNNETTANIVVGYTFLGIGNIHEKWILDCITQGVLLNKNKYALVDSNIIT